jgi:phosphatidylserine/phosphatidylglycerophosphate/cardiolipin synthase-like enzyme
LKSRLNNNVCLRATVNVSGPKLIVQPDDGEKPVMDFLNSAHKTVKWALLGSQNFDQPAFDLRREVAIEVRDAAIVQDLTTMFERDWETSRKYEPPYPIDKPAEEEEDEFPHDTALMHD